MPSSTMTAVRPSRGQRGRPPRNRPARRSSSSRSRASTAARSASETPAIATISSLMIRTPSSPIAPIPSSGWNGTPNLRTTITSSGASSTRATSAATGTPLAAGRARPRARRRGSGAARRVAVRHQRDRRTTWPRLPTRLVGRPVQRAADRRRRPEANVIKSAAGARSASVMPRRHHATTADAGSKVQSASAGVTFAPVGARHGVVVSERDATPGNAGTPREAGAVTARSGAPASTRAGVATDATGTTRSRALPPSRTPADTSADRPRVGSAHFRP